MIALKIIEVKEFMNHLLMMDTFDVFCLCSAEIVREYSVNIDGRISRQFYSDEEREILGIDKERFLKYSRMRPIVHGHIKGRRAPLLIKLTLSMKQDEAFARMKGVSQSKSSIEDFLLNIRYDARGLVLTCGVSYASFNPEKNIEALWDEFITEFLSSQNIGFEKI
mgnify:CR=1 FL=1